MKKNFYFRLVVILFLFSLSGKIALADGFNSVHTSDGNFVIAAGDHGKIFRSLNGGNTWASYTEASVDFKSVFTLGTNVWFTAANGNVYISNNSSTVLTPVNTGITTSLNSIYFVDSNLGFVCGDNGIVYRTNNGGTTWSPSNSGIPAVNLNSISFLNSSNGIVVGNNGSVYVTNNGGTSWTAETVPSTRNLLDVSYMNDGIVIAGEWGTLLNKISGVWSSVATRIRTDIRGVSGTSVNNTHVCGGGGFIRNNTSGSAAYKNFEKNPMLANLVDITYSGSKGFAVSSMNYAVIRTINGGNSWELPTGSTVTYQWEAKPGASGNFLGNNLSLHPTDRNTVFIAFGNQIYRSRDKGDSWTTIGNTIPSGSTPHSFYVSPLDTNIWVVAIQSSPDKIYRTTDYGTTWSMILSMNFSSYGQPLEMDQNNPHNFYFAPDNGGFYRSTDDGATFNEISGNFAFRSPCDILVMWDNPNIIFLADGITGSGLATLYKSINGGVNWNLVHTNASSSEIPSMCNSVFDPSTFWFTEWPGSNIYKTTNFGNNWDIHHSNSFSGWGSDICHEDPTFMITGSWSNKATLSINSGDTWTDISSGLGGHGGGILIPERGNILAHQGSNIYKLNVSYSVITGVSENIISSVAQDYSLSQNYPNPFNPSTKISYSLPKAGNVTLKVYNELGKEMNELVNDYKGAGTYEVSFDASELTSGIYFYKISATGGAVNFTSTKKMLLLK